MLVSNVLTETIAPGDVDHSNLASNGAVIRVLPIMTSSSWICASSISDLLMPHHSLVVRWRHERGGLSGVSSLSWASFVCLTKALC